MIKPGLIRWCIIPLLVLVMAGCTGSNESNPPTVSGVAAAGSVLVGTVHLKDSSVPAKELSMPIAADGSFLFDLSGLTAPYILNATGTANGRNFMLYSFAPTAGIANINPLSSLAVTLANGSDDLQSLYSSPELAKMLVIMNSLPSTISTVQTALYPTLAKFGADAVNFISAPYLANHQGIDLFLDNAAISTSNGTVFLYDRTSSNVVQVSFSGFMAGSYDFVLNPVTTATVFISPALTHLNTNASKTFTANVIGSNDQSVTWSIVEDSGGSITGDGVYTAPATAGTYHVMATSAADSTKSATAAIVVGGAMGSIQIVPSGSGEYTVMGSNFSNVGGVEVTITYDPNYLVNPRITQGPMLAGTMFIPNLRYMTNSVKIAAMSLRAISGSGTLAIITFDLLGAAPNTPVITSAKLSPANPASLPVSSDVPVPPVDKPPSSSAGGSVPAARASGSGASPP